METEQNKSSLAVDNDRQLLLTWPSPTHFLMLPRELRDQVYELHLEANSLKIPGGPRLIWCHHFAHLKLLFCANHQIYAEFSELLFQKCHLVTAPGSNGLRRVRHIQNKHPEFQGTVVLESSNRVPQHELDLTYQIHQTLSKGNLGSGYHSITFLKLDGQEEMNVQIISGISSNIAKQIRGGVRSGPRWVPIQWTYMGKDRDWFLAVRTYTCGMIMLSGHIGRFEQLWSRWKKGGHQEQLRRRLHIG